MLVFGANTHVPRTYGLMIPIFSPTKNEEKKVKTKIVDEQSVGHTHCERNESMKDQKTDEIVELNKAEN